MGYRGGPDPAHSADLGDVRADGNGDGLTDPVQVDDAALAAARYLCHSGDLSQPATWRAVSFSYNHSDGSVDDVAVAANRLVDAVG